MRVGVVFDNFGPYHVARLAAAGRQLDILGIEVGSTSDEYDWNMPDIPGSIERVRLVDDAAARSDWAPLLTGYRQKVSLWRPDVIALPGWSSVAALAGACWAAECGIPAVLMSDSNARDFARLAMLELVKRRVVAQFGAGLCAGSLARSYLVDLGLPPERCFMGYDVVDNDHFRRGAAAARAAPSAPDGIEAGWRGRYFLAVARLLPKKNLDGLVDAYSRYRRAAGSGAWPLVLLGDGPLRGELEGRRAALGLDGVLAMPGFVQYEQLPAYYGNAGAFLHASTTEQWGLVVNEAMASGLPVLVSERCGCAPDLVQADANGYIFDPDSVPELSRLMLDIAADPNKRERMGETSRRIIARWSAETFATALRQAAEEAVRHGPALLRPLDRALLWGLAHR